MNKHGIKIAALIMGISIGFVALIVGSAVLGQAWFPGWVGGVGALGLCLGAMFVLIAWAESR